MSNDPGVSAARCQNLVWREAGYYRCSLPVAHGTACVPDQAHVIYDQEMARRMLAELDLREGRLR